MNRTFTPQEQQQLNSTGMCDDSAVLDDGNIKESVANREEQQEIRNKRILIVDDEPDITFTLRVILEENGFKEMSVYYTYYNDRSFKTLRRQVILHLI